MIMPLSLLLAQEKVREMRCSAYRPKPWCKLPALDKPNCEMLTQQNSTKLFLSVQLLSRILSRKFYKMSIAAVHLSELCQRLQAAAFTFTARERKCCSL